MVDQTSNEARLTDAPLITLYGYIKHEYRLSFQNRVCQVFTLTPLDIKPRLLG
jgi:hypothetical protein